MKLGKRIILFGGLATGSSLWADVTLSDLSYTSDGSEIMITDCDEAASGSLVIPTTIDDLPVTAIGDSAFRDCSEITSVVVPEGVESLGKYAFNNCSDMSSATLPSSLTNVGTFAFARTNVVSITIPGGVKDVPGEVFLGCNNLISATFLEGVETIGDQLFLGSDSLQLVYLPSTLTSYSQQKSDNGSPHGTFHDTPSLTTIIVADGNGNFSSDSGALYSADYSEILLVPSGTSGTLTVHDDTVSSNNYAFEDCEWLTKIEFGSNFQGIGNYWLRHSVALEAFEVSDQNLNIQAIDGVMYSADGSELMAFPTAKLGTYVVNDGARNIHDYAFYGASGLSSIVTPDSLESIGVYAFKGASALEVADIQGALDSLPNYCFGSCTSLNSVSLSESIVNLGNRAFDNCTVLQSLDSAPFVSLGSGSFTNCKVLDEVVLAGSLTTLPDGCFQGSGIKSIDLPSSLVTVEDGVFNSCNELEELIFPGSVTSFGEELLYDMEKLRYVEFSEGITAITAYVFYESQSVEYVVLPSTLETLESECFSDVPSLKAILFKGDIPSDFDSDAFYSVNESAVCYYFDETGGWDESPVVYNESSARYEVAGLEVQSINSVSYPAAAWLMQHGFEPLQDVSEDSNGDGLPLLLEYALNLDPSHNNNDAMPQVTLGESGLELEFYAQSSGLMYDVQQSTDLVNWSGTGVSLSGADSDGFRVASVASDQEKLFMRLQVFVGDL